MQNFGRNLDVLAQGLKSGITGLMNLVTQTADSANGIYFVTFNQDCTSLAIGTNTGYKLFSLNSVDSLEEIYEDDNYDACIVERLFSSSLVALVSLSAPRKMRVCHFKKGTEICNYSYSNTILAVKLNRSRLVVCLEESLYIHNIRDMRIMHTIRDTPPNPSGLVTLSISSENCFLAYPGSNTIGEVQIFDATNLHAKIMIPAHDSPLAALAFSPSGKEIATASEKGTVIRVFAIQDGSKLYEFRRGVKRCVSISSLVFSTDSNYLCCSSNTETVHIFKLDEPKEGVRPGVEDNQGWIGYLTKAVSASANYLPTQVTDVFNQGRAFATVHLPFQGIRNICAITKIQKVLRLLVAAADGFLYIYNLDPSGGGDCTLAKQHCCRVGFAASSSRHRTQDPAPAAAAAAATAPASTSDQKDGKSTRGSAENKTNPGSISSYAGIVKGRTPGTMSDSEKFNAIAAATESPPKGGFRLDDDDEFPPVTQITE